ncbi:MAG: glycosyltransferase family 4 protein [Clostridia bacterium]|nr:glycosyltransferase family 4 protein [Clostridia bacterium]
MKIYEIGTGYTPIPAQVAAATESVVEELTKAFMAMGQDVEILDISTQNRAPNDLPIAEVKVASFFTRSDVQLGVIHKVKRVVYSLALASKLKKILKTTEEKVVLHFHNQYNLFFFLKTVSERLWRKKAVIAYTNHNGFWSLPWNESEQILHKRYFQEIEAMKRADLVFVLNDCMKENVVTHLAVPAERVIRINDGVNTDLYRPLTADEIEKTKEAYALSGKKVILQVGSVNENKGQGRSVRLLAPFLKQNCDLVFAYVGGIVSEKYFEEVKKTAEELGVSDRVQYLGAVSPGEEMNRIYNMADATIFISKYESFGLVCVESLSAGVPVLLCSKTLLNFGVGCIECHYSTTSEIALKIISDKEQRADLSMSARANAIAHYTWAQIAEDYLKKMQSLY